MSIEKREIYVVICDVCNEILDETGEGGTVYETIKKAQERAEYVDWKITKESCLCSNCEFINRETE